MLILAIMGCASPIYIPDHLSDIPRTELSRVGGTGGFKEFRRILAIDGVEIPRGSDVYVSPGEHEVDYSYIRHVTEYITSGSWNTKLEKKSSEIGKCKLIFEAGQKYDVIELMTMLEDAGCRMVVSVRTIK
jgi:hypothetical protein